MTDRTFSFALFVIALIFAFTSVAQTQPVTPKDPRWKQLSQAYGFIVGQNTSLDLIAKTYRDLAKQTKETRFAFDSTVLGEGAKGVEAELSKRLGDNWPEFRKTMSSEVNSVLAKQKLTREIAVSFLAEVRDRAKGEMQESVRASLLSANPRYVKNPTLELTEGWKQTYRTKGHAKAKGTDFSVSHPMSWSKREGNRPNIIQVFQSGAGHGEIMSMLLVQTVSDLLGHKPSKQEIEMIFQLDTLKELTPEGGKFISAQTTVLEGLPAGIVVCDVTQQRLDLTLTTRMTQFVMIYGDSMIFLQFAVAPLPGTKESLDQLHERSFPIYKAIANTFLLNDKYK